VVLIYVITSIHKILLLIFVENKDEVSDFVHRHLHKKLQARLPSETLGHRAKGNLVSLLQFSK
jgi:hypothetical protein